MVIYDIIIYHNRNCNILLNTQVCNTHFHERVLVYSVPVYVYACVYVCVYIIIRTISIWYDRNNIDTHTLHM